MTFDEIDERYHDAALDDGGEAWPEDATPEPPADAGGDPGSTVPAEREGVRPSRGRA